MPSCTTMYLSYMPFCTSMYLFHMPSCTSLSLAHIQYCTSRYIVLYMCVSLCCTCVVLILLPYATPHADSCSHKVFADSEQLSKVPPILHPYGKYKYTMEALYEKKWWAWMNMPGIIYRTHTCCMTGPLCVLLLLLLYIQYYVSCQRLQCVGLCLLFSCSSHQSKVITPSVQYTYIITQLTEYSAVLCGMYTHHWVFPHCDRHCAPFSCLSC